jgi:two-component system phosphate regulon sensor histidine kinase PhoR
MKMLFKLFKPELLIKKAATIIENQAKAKSIEIKLDVSGSLPEVKVDESRFLQIMINLLDNAVKYSPEGGKVIICAKAKEGYLQIDISDTGIGISESDLPAYSKDFTA